MSTVGTPERDTQNGVVAQCRFQPDIAPATIGSGATATADWHNDSWEGGC